MARVTHMTILTPLTVLCVTMVIPMQLDAKIFITTLKKGTRLWMTSLPPNSIRSWQELCNKFCDRFGGNRRRGKLTVSLI